MTVYYIDPQGGSAGNNGTSEATPKNAPPSPVAGDVWRFKRGTTYTYTAQWGIWNPVVITDYGDPSAPAPILTGLVTASSASLNSTADLIVHNVDFADCQPATGGGNCFNMSVRGGGAGNSGPGAGGVFLNVGFRNIKGSALMLNPNDGSTPTASADMLAVLGCKFQGIGDDALFVKVGGYLEVGWCDIRDVSMLSTTGDCIHNMDSFLRYAWIHDNYLDHTATDYKQCIMLDNPTAGNPAGLAVIERNVILGAMTHIDDGASTVNHVPVNAEMRTILRQNFIRSKRYGALVGDSVVAANGPSEVYSNIFDVMAPGGNGPLILRNDASVVNNTFWARTSSDWAVAVIQALTTKVSVDRNLFVGFSSAMNNTSTTAKIASADRNAFLRTPAKGMTTTNDVMLTADPAPGPVAKDFRPRDAAMFFRSFDRRYPDFLGRFDNRGIAHIGACLGAF